MKRYLSFLLAVAAFCCWACSGGSDNTHSLGIGIYPGDPAENFAPVVKAGDGTLRNIALLRAARHSSSADYNQTAQLVTDGIIPSAPACGIDLTVEGRTLTRQEKGYLTDRNVSGVRCSGPEAKLEIRFKGYDVCADRLVLAAEWDVPQTAVLTVEGEKDGEWIPLGSARPVGTKDMVGESRSMLHHKEFVTPLSQKGPFSAFRLSVNAPGEFTVNDAFFYLDGKELDILPSRFFTSSWKSAGAENEWVEIDLGAPSSFSQMNFCWINGPSSASVLVSDDGKAWKEIGILDSPVPELRFPTTKGRYVRLSLKSSVNGEPFELGEWEVIGKGGTVAVPKKAPAREAKRQLLCGGSWELIRGSQCTGEGEKISTCGFDTQGWIPATVPGTILGTFVDIGAVHHPNYADNQLFISDSYFRSDFWYRNEFDARIDTPVQVLHFEGINWKAEVFLNGSRIGDIQGAFRTADFDVTGILKNGRNCLAVRIIENENYGLVKEQTAYTPDKNGGILGADNPTMHATIGWDWIPTVRGRGAGIYDDVWLAYSGPVTISDPFVRTELPLPDTTSATLYASAVLANHSDAPVSGTLEWSFGPVSASKAIELAPRESREISFDPALMDKPKLWWPKGYGEPHLYPVRFSFRCESGLSDETEFLSGVRQMSYSMDSYDREDIKYSGGFTGRDDSKRLSLYVNGRRFIGFGGNWGYPEHLLNYRAREYDAAVAYHADMNFTLIRDWVGMIGSRYFYEACDRHGVMIWQDFWLANPWDGPDPNDPVLFNETAQQYVRRIRNHPSLALYVGRNEGYPPAEIDSFLQEMIAAEHPGMCYIPHSAADGVSGGGPYRALPIKDYFHQRGLDKLHSEMGMPNVMNWENLLRTMGPDAVEPYSSIAHPNPMYGLHDYTLGVLEGCAQYTESFNQLLEQAFGAPENARAFAELAQWINYEGYRAMFEARGAQRRGLLLWMSHPAWPSMVWQTYDYYFEPTAAYFGCKKACEPLHIQFNRYTGIVEAVNYHSRDREGLTATATVLDMNGQALSTQSNTFDLAEDSSFNCFRPEIPEGAGEVYYLKLALCDGEGKVLSDNFYVLGAEEGNLRALNTLPKATVAVEQTGDLTRTVTLTNNGTVPALMLRLKLSDSATGDLVLPVMYSDNWFSLMPGESKTVTVSAKPMDVKGKALLEVSGFNL